MNTRRNYCKCRTILVFSMLVSCLFGFGQKKQEDTFNIHKASFFLPQPLPGGHYSSSISVLYVVTPKDWTLDNITAPMFSYQAKYTLPKGFNLQAGLSSLIISNRIYLGPYWNYKINDNYYRFGMECCLELWQTKSVWICNHINRMGAATIHFIWSCICQNSGNIQGRSVLDQCVVPDGR